MRSRLAVLLIVSAALLAAPAAAMAGVPWSKVLRVREGSALAEVQSMSSVPVGWGSSAGEAVAALKRTSTLVALHHRMHPLRVYPYVWRSDHPYWYVMFLYHGKIVASASVSPAGKVTGVWTGPQAAAPYTHGHQPGVLTSWMVLLPASLLFLLPFLDPRRLRQIAHFDGLVVLAFLISFLLFAGAHLESAVWLAYPPLIYLLFRLLGVGFRPDRAARRLAPLLSMRVLVIGLPLLLAVRIALSLLGHHEIDVGTQSVVGAFRMLHHLPLYWNDPNHGDTYGPITYLAYAPFELVFPWRNSFGDLPAADAAAIVFDLGTVLGLILLGRRLRSGVEGTRLGLVLAWAWAACPFTVIGLIVHTNDALIAMLSVFALVVITSPIASGAAIGLAAAAKFSPAGLLPLLAAPRQRGLRGALMCVCAFTAVVVGAIFAWLPSGGLGYFWQRTVGYQISRADVFSPWALHPGLHPIQTILELTAMVLVAAIAFVPRERSLVRVCALAGAVTIAIQLPATHWYYYYILWFLPFALVALLVPDAMRQGKAAKPQITAPDLAVTEAQPVARALVGV
jgi:hypothetical protein